MQMFFCTYLFNFFTLIHFALILTFWEQTSYQFSLAQMLSGNEFESHMCKHVKKLNCFRYSQVLMP